jgi:hypothetical protein
VDAVHENTNMHIAGLGEKFSAVAAAFQQEVRVLNEKVDALEKKNNDNMQLLNDKCQEILDMIKTMKNEPKTPTNPMEPTTNSVAQLNPSATGVAAALNLNAYQVMRTSPRVPSMSQNFPDSWILLFQEWQLNRLCDFEKKGTKGNWSNDQQQRYAKRFRAMKVLKTMAGNKKPLKQMAEDLESARIQQNSMSMTNHIEMLYKKYLSYKPRSHKK